MVASPEDKKHYEHMRVKRAERGTSIEMRPQNIAVCKEFVHWKIGCIKKPRISSVFLSYY